MPLSPAYFVNLQAFNHDFGLGSTPHAKMIMNSWKNQSDLGLQVSGFVVSSILHHKRTPINNAKAMLMLRLFPFITSLPLKAIQAQGETKTIAKVPGSLCITPR